MQLSWSAKTIKYLMFLFNLFFVITGIIFIGVGVTVKTVYTDYSYFLDGKYFSLPNMLIATGVLIFFVSFFGCCGAIKENWILLAVFSILLIIIFIFEFSAGIAGYVLRDKTVAYLNSTLYENLNTYQDHSHGVWDLIQSNFECCGVNGPNDWLPVFQNGSLPVSCCGSVSGTVGAFYCYSDVETTTVTVPISTASSTENTSTTNITDSNITVSITESSTSRKRRAVYSSLILNNSSSVPWQTGCKVAFGNYIKSHALQIGGWAMGIAVVQFIGIVFSCHLVRQLKNGYSST
ncbi:CD63 antigen [Cylas formicarius]|uniref:CD63 antigen n=1 Tax=Cylas formicarius TaxID=197179 RepID=UPI002958D3C4|nr:CD63 antigen [Cylas formicarius]